MAIHAVEAPDFDTQLADAAAATEVLARRFFGDAAYLRRDVAVDRETGREDEVFEVHYQFPDAEANFDRLVILHQAFTRAFVHATSRDILPRIVLRPVPTDTD